MTAPRLHHGHADTHATRASKCVTGDLVRKPRGARGQPCDDGQPCKDSHRPADFSLFSSMCSRKRVARRSRRSARSRTRRFAGSCRADIPLEADVFGVAEISAPAGWATRSPYGGHHCVRFHRDRFASCGCEIDKIMDNLRPERASGSLAAQHMTVCGRTEGCYRPSGRPPQPACLAAVVPPIALTSMHRRWRRPRRGLSRGRRRPWR